MYELNIPGSLLKEALEQFSIQTGLQISTDEETRSSPDITVALAGRYSVDIALSALLGATDFVYERIGEDSIAIRYGGTRPESEPFMTLDRARIERLHARSAEDAILYAARALYSLSTAPTEQRCAYPPILLFNGLDIARAAPGPATLKPPDKIPASAIERIEIWPIDTEGRPMLALRGGAINIVMDIDELVTLE